MPYWRIVFSTICGCMSFHTGSVKLRKAHCQQMLSGLPSLAAHGRTWRDVARVPIPELVQPLLKNRFIRSPRRRARSVGREWMIIIHGQQQQWNACYAAEHGGCQQNFHDHSLAIMPRAKLPRESMSRVDR
jgi:hypothetical protein